MKKICILLIFLISSSYAQEDKSSKWKMGVGIEGFDPIVLAEFMWEAKQEKEPALALYFIPLPTISFISPKEELFVNIGWYNGIDWRFYKWMYVGIGIHWPGLLSMRDSEDLESTKLALTFPLGIVNKISHSIYFKAALPFRLIWTPEKWSNGGAPEDIYFFPYFIQLGITYVR